MKKAFAVVLFLAAMFPLSAMSADNFAQFQGGIGVIPVSNITLNDDGTVSAVSKNTVREVPPPGQIWVISDLKAEVKTDGRIKVDGRGLLLGGGNGIGTGGSGNSPTEANPNPTNLSVFATLICEVKAPFTRRNTTLTGVQLDENGDFRIDDMLTPAPPAPADCTKPVLLIRNTGGAPNQPWFAAGIPK